ncbi:hypothetical protein DID88_010470 [Monilinia fructigena]|uniref:PI31 proteasome regulator C-terminal domain-containing protein n=1 Tax=Monilinia fructigena TaxID=38457 RepID=A0A395ILV6_9HELO|nr:hypothetical protein DID88_010470 [Monilinia fructigena]
MIQPTGSPFNIGHDDFTPTRTRPQRPITWFVHRGRGSGGLGGFGGMHPTFTDPLFGRQGQGGAGRSGNGGFNPHAPPAQDMIIGTGDGPQRGGGGKTS